MEAGLDNEDTRWILTLFGRMSFFPRYLEMATGKHRGALVINISRNALDTVRQNIERSKSAAEIVQFAHFCEHEKIVDNASPGVLSMAIRDSEDGAVLEKAVLEARPSRMEYVVVARIEDGADVSRIGWAVIRDQPK